MADQIRTGLDWEDVRIFAALARYGSLSATARALSLTHATIARRMRSLEQAMGERLVERRPHGYVLTPAGSRALLAASAMESAAATLARGGDDEGPRGLVRISAPPSLVHGFLAGRLAVLATRHAALDLDMVSELRAVSLERREADIAIRLGKPAEGDVIARLLLRMGFGFYASAHWRAQLQAGVTPTFIGFDEANSALPEAVWLGQHYPHARVAFRASSHLAQASAAQAGAGIALLPHFIAREADGLLGCTLEHMPPARELWLLVRREGRKDLPTRTVADFLTRLFADERGRFE